MANKSFEASCAADKVNQSIASTEDRTTLDIIQGT
jgi:hypothetical protein